MESTKNKVTLLVRDEDGKLKDVKMCLLSQAAATNDTSTVCQLLDKADKFPEVAKTLLKCKDTCFGFTAFHWAAKYGSSESLEAMLKFSKDHGYVHLDLNDPKCCSSKKIHLDKVKLKIIKNKSVGLYARNNPLHVACQSSQLDCVKLLVEYGFSPKLPNSHNQTPLHFACMELDLPTISYIVQECKLGKSDLNHPQSCCINCDTPLFKLIRSKVDDQDSKIACMELLLKNGADPMSRGCYGASTVQRATLSREPETLRTLLNHMKENYTSSQILDLLNHTNGPKGMLGKPLDLALEPTRGMDIEMVKLLLSSGAKPSLKNFDQVCR